MSEVIIISYKELEAFLGKEIEVSEYHTITQEQINKFADATLIISGYALIRKGLKLSHLLNQLLHIAILRYPY